MQDAAGNEPEFTGKSANLPLICPKFKQRQTISFEMRNLRFFSSNYPETSGRTNRVELWYSRNTLKSMNIPALEPIFSGEERIIKEKHYQHYHSKKRKKRLWMDLGKVRFRGILINRWKGRRTWYFASQIQKKVRENVVKGERTIKKTSQFSTKVRS